MRHRRRLSLEPLENRQLLAGNVLIDTSDGNLVITGDALANRVAIRQTGLGQFTVTGLDREQFRTPGGLFKKGPVTVSNVRGGLFVSLSSGDDYVKVQGEPGHPVTAAFVTVLTGPGRDQVMVDQVQTGGSQYPPQIQIPQELKRQRSAIGEAAYWNAVTPGSLTIDSGAGDRSLDGDTVTLTGVEINGPAMISTGTGPDLVTLDDVTGRQAVIGTAAGTDRVELAGQGAVSFVTLNMMMGDDDDLVSIGTGPFTLTGVELSRFEGGRGRNYLTGYANLDPLTRSRLVNPRSTGFVVDPVR